MAADSEHIRFLLDLLRPLGPVVPKRLFGTTSLTLDGLVFGLVYDDRLFLKVDDASRPAFEAEGQDPFTYTRRGRAAALRSFYTMPDAAYDEPDEALAWAQRAVEAALRAHAAKSATRRSRKAR